MPMRRPPLFALTGGPSSLAFRKMPRASHRPSSRARQQRKYPPLGRCRASTELAPSIHAKFTIIAVHFPDIALIAAGPARILSHITAPEKALIARRGRRADEEPAFAQSIAESAVARLWRPFLSPQGRGLHRPFCPRRARCLWLRL